MGVGRRRRAPHRLVGGARISLPDPIPSATRVSVLLAECSTEPAGHTKPGICERGAIAAPRTGAAPGPELGSPCTDAGQALVLTFPALGLRFQPRVAKYGVWIQGQNTGSARDARKQGCWRRRFPGDAGAIPGIPGRDPGRTGNQLKGPRYPQRLRRGFDAAQFAHRPSHPTPPVGKHSPCHPHPRARPRSNYVDAVPYPCSYTQPARADLRATPLQFTLRFCVKPASMHRAHTAVAFRRLRE